MVALVRVHGLRCSKASASYSEHCRAMAHCSRIQISLITKRGAFSASASVEPGLYSLRQQERKGACSRLSAGGFGFQTKVKEHIGIFGETNRQILSATGSIVLFLFSKACYLCCLPHVTLWRLSLIFLDYYLFYSSVFAKHSVIY